MLIDPAEAAEEVLLSHPGVGHAVVTEGADRRLVAQVVPVVDDDDGLDVGDVVEGWAEVFDQLYADPDAGPFRGWIDRVTGEPIPAGHMEAWRRGIVDRVRALGGARLLEIGAGEGLLAGELAAGADEYWATDSSAEALDLLADRPGLVRRHLAADDTEDLPAGHFDVVVVNSVVQYFPDAEYLATVLHHLAALLAPGGAIVVGDVRALALGRLHHDALTVARAGDEVAADRAFASEAELLVDPAFFDDVVAASPVLRRTEVALPEHGDTEMGRYRYDVVLHSSPSTPVSVTALPWRGLDAWAEALDGDAPALVLAGVPNARLTGDLAATATLRGRALSSDGGADPADLVAAARARGYAARAVFGTEDPYTVDVLAHRPGTPPPAHTPARPGATTNEPAIAMDPSSAVAFADGLRAYAAAHLPPAVDLADVTIVSRLP